MSDRVRVLLRRALRELEGLAISVVEKKYWTEGIKEGERREKIRRKSFLDEAIAHAKEQERQRILALVKKQGQPWETIVIQELVDQLEGAQSA
jgi:hypothetical protein